MYCSDSIDVTGIPAILKAVINDKEGIRLIGCMDGYDNSYVMFPAVLPWELNIKEKGLTIEKLDSLFSFYISKISNSNFETDYIAAENWG